MTAQPDVIPLGPEIWRSFASFFRAHQPGCFCRWPRCEPRTFVPDGSEHEQAMHAVVASGECPGLVAFSDEEPVGWCAIGPVTDYAQYRVSEPDAGGLACLLVASEARGHGVGRALVRAAIARAEAHGAPSLFGPPPWWQPESDHVRDRVVALLLGHEFHEVETGARLPLLRKQLT